MYPSPFRFLYVNMPLQMDTIRHESFNAQLGHTQQEL